MTKEKFINILGLYDNKESCWEWSGRKDSCGYGRLKISGNPVSAHRMSWIINFGEIPSGMYVCHHCDNPSCVNPNHLFVGTQKDNMRDMRTKGRGHDFSCENNPRAKLTDQDVIEMRKKYIPYKYSSCRLAREYGVTQRAAWLVVTGNGWRKNT